MRTGSGGGGHPHPLPRRLREPVAPQNLNPPTEPTRVEGVGLEGLGIRAEGPGLRAEGGGLRVEGCGHPHPLPRRLRVPVSPKL
jgi:hypothetical protein